MGSNKILLLLLILTIVVIGTIFFFVFYSKDSAEPAGVQAAAVETALINGEVFDENGDVLQTTPGNYYLVYEVATDNPVEEIYSIFYSESDGQFEIFIPYRPFDQIRAQAETRFLRLIGLESRQQDACRLNVRILVPNWGDPEYAGRTLPLSICER